MESRDKFLRNVYVKCVIAALEDYADVPCPETSRVVMNALNEFRKHVNNGACCEGSKEHICNQ